MRYGRGFVSGEERVLGLKELVHVDVFRCSLFILKRKGCGTYSKNEVDYQFMNSNPVGR